MLRFSKGKRRKEDQVKERPGSVVANNSIKTNEPVTTQLSTENASNVKQNDDDERAISYEYKQNPLGLMLYWRFTEEWPCRTTIDLSGCKHDGEMWFRQDHTNSRRVKPVESPFNHEDDWGRNALESSIVTCIGIKPGITDAMKLQQSSTGNQNYSYIISSEENSVFMYCCNVIDSRLRCLINNRNAEHNSDISISINDQIPDPQQGDKENKKHLWFKSAKKKNEAVETSEVSDEEFINVDDNLEEEHCYDLQYGFTIQTWVRFIQEENQKHHGWHIFGVSNSWSLWLISDPNATFFSLKVTTKAENTDQHTVFRFKTKTMSFFQFNTWFYVSLRFDLLQNMFDLTLKPYLADCTKSELQEHQFVTFELNQINIGHSASNKNPLFYVGGATEYLSSFEIIEVRAFCVRICDYCVREQSKALLSCAFDDTFGITNKFKGVKIRSKNNPPSMDGSNIIPLIPAPGIATNAKMQRGSEEHISKPELIIVDGTIQKKHEITIKCRSVVNDHTNKSKSANVKSTPNKLDISVVKDTPLTVKDTPLTVKDTPLIVKYVRSSHRLDANEDGPKLSETRKIQLKTGDEGEHHKIDTDVLKTHTAMNTERTIRGNLKRTAVMDLSHGLTCIQLAELRDFSQTFSIIVHVDYFTPITYQSQNLLIYDIKQYILKWRLKVDEMLRELATTVSSAEIPTAISKARACIAAIRQFFTELHSMDLKLPIYALAQSPVFSRDKTIGVCLVAVKQNLHKAVCYIVACGCMEYIKDRHNAFGTYTASQIHGIVKPIEKFSNRSNTSMKAEGILCIPISHSVCRLPIKPSHSSFFAILLFNLLFQFSDFYACDIVGRKILSCQQNGFFKVDNATETHVKEVVKACSSFEAASQTVDICERLRDEINLPVVKANEFFSNTTYNQNTLFEIMPLIPSCGICPNPKCSSNLPPFTDTCTRCNKPLFVCYLSLRNCLKEDRRLCRMCSATFSHQALCLIVTDSKPMLNCPLCGLFEIVVQHT